jgi:hypothetical protein
MCIGEAGIERRAAGTLQARMIDRLSACAGGQRHRTVRRRSCIFDAARTGGRSRGPHQGCANLKVELLHFLEFRAAKLEHALAIMRLNPVAQKPGRHRQPKAIGEDAFERDARKPARVNVFANLGAEPAANAIPTQGIIVWHFRFRLLLGNGH